MTFNIINPFIFLEEELKQELNMSNQRTKQNTSVRENYPSSDSSKFLKAIIIDNLHCYKTVVFFNVK